MIDTSMGYIPSGIIDHKAYSELGVLIHFYKALLHDPKDTSFYPLVETNDLLLPPVIVNRFAFDGYCHVIIAKNAPTIIPSTASTTTDTPTTWSPDERTFAPKKFVSSRNQPRNFTHWKSAA